MVIHQASEGLPGFGTIKTISFTRRLPSNSVTLQQAGKPQAFVANARVLPKTQDSVTRVPC